MILLSHQFDCDIAHLCDCCEQIASLPLRQNKESLEVLMVTSRDTGRWVVPKGWPMDGKKDWTAAEIEALEEAGAKGHIGKSPIGFYHYLKRMDGREDIPCHVTVYPMVVETLKKRWKERKERKRKWFSLKASAKRVDEEDLARLLKDLETSDLPKQLRKRF